MKEKGITIVALVVTIIILLILVGITISQISGDSGLFVKTRQAVDKYKNASEKEEMSLEELEKYIDNPNFNFDSEENKEILEELKSKLQGLESEKESLEKRVGELETQNSELSKSKEENEREIEDLKKQISELEHKDGFVALFNQKFTNIVKDAIRPIPITDYNTNYATVEDNYLTINEKGSYTAYITVGHSPITTQGGTTAGYLQINGSEVARIVQNYSIATGVSSYKFTVDENQSCIINYYIKADISITQATSFGSVIIVKNS